MDKINQITDNAVIKHPSASGKSNSKTFQSALATVLKGKNAESTRPKPTVPLGEISPVYSKSVAIGRAESLSQTEQLIEMLDHYTAQLKDPGNSLKDLAPLMNEIKSKAATLAASSGDDMADSSLKKIIDKVTLTATVEYVKFYRGDLV